MPWFIPFNHLDPDQREFVDDRNNNNYFIKGYAGTGKSVVLLHKLIHIYQQNPNAKCCIISFTHSLLEMFKLGIEETGMLSARVSNEINSCCAKLGQIDLVTKYEFRRNINCQNPVNYDFIMIDEVQDLCPSDLQNALNSGAGNIYLGGDENQSIYSEDPKDREPTLNPNEINKIIEVTEKSLLTLYRITPSILRVAKRLMPELEEALNGVRFGHTRDAEVILANSEDERDEVKYVLENALTYAEDIELTAILFPEHSWIKAFFTHVLEINNVPITNQFFEFLRLKNYSEINNIFVKHDIRIEFVGNRHGSFKNAKQNHNIVVMTYYSAKGMDFDNVFIPFLSRSREDIFSYFIPRPLMVAITRSNLNLTLSYSGESMSCIDIIRSTCFSIDIDEENETDYLD